MKGQMNGKRQKAKPTSRQVSQRLEELEKQFEQFQNLQAQKLKALGNTLQTIWANQVELSKSETRLDEQFCVQGRLFITSINEILLRANSDEVITYEQVNKMFMEWEKFRSRPDFRDHMRAWFMGDDLSTLPPPPEPKEKAPEETPSPEAEGPQEFGGDYGEASDVGNQAAQEGRPAGHEGGSSDPVSEGQDADGASRQASALP